MKNLENEESRPDYSADCDRAPIHNFAAVQGHGCAMGFSWPNQRIQIVSDNTKAIIGLEQREVLGAKLDHIFEAEFVRLLGEHVQRYPWTTKGRHLQIRAQVAGNLFDAFLFHSEGLFFIELEPHQTTYEEPAEIEGQQILRSFMIKAKGLTSIEELSKLVCVTIRRLTGLDRVMMYRFLPPSWHGEVIAEDRVTTAHSYMGHRFPATDIPAPARSLYLRNQVRLIPDVHLPTASLVPPLNPLTKKPVDLSDSRLRAVAPIHLEYLKNMGVEASFSVAVTDDEVLWGLITCHHLQPVLISQAKRTICEIIAHAFSIQAPLLEKNLLQNGRLEFEFKLKKILESLRLAVDPLDHFFKQHRTVTEAFRASGLALVSDGLNDFAGLTPLKADIEDLAQWLRTKMAAEKSSVLAIDHLSGFDRRWERIKDYASGVLATLIPELNNSLLLLFRPEWVQTVSWGGDPRKQLERRQFQGAINPRESFQTWQETISSRSLTWTKYEIDAMTFLRDFVFEGLVRKEQRIRELMERVQTNQRADV